MSAEYAWITEARKFIGLREVKGIKHNPTIVDWLRRLNAWWRDDETPWCATFVTHCLVEAGLPKPKNWFRAMAYLEYGQPLLEPTYGCLVVFSRKGGGHVGFVVGKDTRGYLMVLGGNQDNQVSILPFPLARVAGYRWPYHVEGLLPHQMPLVSSTLEVSTNEA